MPYYHTPTGLVVAERDASRDSVERELKRIDKDLRLLQDWDAAHQKPVYWVGKFISHNIEAAPIVHWRDTNGTPLPLSHGIVETARQHRADSPYTPPDPLMMNDKLQAANDRAFDDLARDAFRWGSRVSSPGHSAVYHRSVSLRMARDKRRSRGENI